MSKILKIPNVCVFFPLASVVVDLLSIFWFLQNKSCKIYLGPMLPPGDKNWQLIYPNCARDCIGLRIGAK